MGANHLGEIKRLSQISSPTIGIITNIAPSHLKFFGDIENVFKAKSELINSLKRNSIILLNKDDEFLSGVRPKCKRIYFGLDSDCEFRARDIEKKGKRILFNVKKSRFSITLFGRHNVYNALAAIALGQVFGIRLNILSKILGDFKNPFNDRLSFSKNNYLEMLNDTYNSNPLSLKRAVESMIDLGKRKRKIIVSADMLELGKKSKYLHEEAGKNIAQAGVDVFISIGPMSRYASQSALRYGMKKANVIHFTNHEDLIGNLHDILKKGDIVLVKGSRGMHMEKVTDYIKSKLAR